MYFQAQASWKQTISHCVAIIKYLWNYVCCFVVVVVVLQELHEFYMQMLSMVSKCFTALFSSPISFWFCGFANLPVCLWGPEYRFSSNKCTYLFVLCPTSEFLSNCLHENNIHINLISSCQVTKSKQESHSIRQMHPVTNKSKK